MCPKIRKEYLKSLQCVWDFVGVESAYLGVDFFFFNIPRDYVVFNDVRKVQKKYRSTTL